MSVCDLLHAVASRSAVGALRDPERADLVAALGDTTGQEALKRMHRLMLNDQGARSSPFARPLPAHSSVACYNHTTPKQKKEVRSE